jgi:hypothetical protein
MDKRSGDGLFWASIVAPVAHYLIALAYVAISAATGASRPPGLDREFQGVVFTVSMWLSTAALVPTIGGLIALIAAFVFAVPLLILGRRFRIVSPFYFMLVGVATASGFFVSMAGLTGHGHTVAWAHLSAAGAIAGLVYWYRVHGRPPDATTLETRK